MSSGWFGLLGVVVGGLITGSTTWWMTSRKDKAEARNIAIAVSGELAAAANLIRRRRFVEGIEQHIDSAKDGDVYAFSIHLPPDPLLPITRSSAEKVGVLNGRLPILIPQIVLWCDGLASDIRRLAQHGVDKDDSLIRSDSPEFAVSMYEEILHLLTDLLSACDDVVKEVNRLYPSQR